MRAKRKIKMKAKRVLLIGWDAADWKVIDQLIERGHMPTLAKMVKNGVRGNLSTLEPVLSPMLWTSIATGKYADKHGIHGFTEPDFEAGMVRPMSSLSRKSRAIWNILTQQGKKSNVFAWWPSNPAEPINGIMVSNLYQRANQPINKPWPMAAGTVYPEDLSAHFKKCRVHPDELTEEHILPFLPLAEKINQDEDKRLGMLSKIIADAASVHAASTWAMENTEWDFTAIYHDAIDHVCHGYMKFRAPQLPGIPNDLFEIYKDVVDGMYRFHDMMLERTLDLAGPDTNIILISDHGFQSDHMRPLQLPKEPAGPAAEHRKHGIICCYGPDFKKGQQIYGSSILDITPTLLTLFGLPIGQDMDGTPLVQAFKSMPSVKKIDSWEHIKGHFGEHDANFKLAKEDAKAAVKQLIELGYVEDPGEDSGKAILNTEIELKYNLSKVYISTGRPSEALALLESIIEDKEEYRFQIRIADCLKKLGRFEESLRWIDRALESDKDHKNKRAILLVKADILKAKGDTQEALRILMHLKDEVGPALSVLKGIADLQLQTEQWKAAEQSFAQCLQIDPHDATSLKGKAYALLKQDQHEKAAEAALSATELYFQFPSAHYILGMALIGLEQYEMAARSLEVVVSMRPSFSAARLALEQLYQSKKFTKEDLFKQINITLTEDDEWSRKAEEQLQKMEGAKSNSGRTLGKMTIVSGLPRSGTSMMMQMLHAGGVEIYTDHKRTPDESNPNGFFEHENVKSIGRNKGWLREAKNKAVKIVSPLIKFLPPSYEYKVIVMKRDVAEIVTSQQKMLEREGKASASTYPVKLEQTLTKQFEGSKYWMGKLPNCDVLEITFEQAIRHPEAVASQINSFLGGHLNVAKMAKVADKKLHRNKLNKA